MNSVEANQIFLTECSMEELNLAGYFLIVEKFVVGLQLKDCKLTS